MRSSTVVALTRHYVHAWAGFTCRLRDCHADSGPVLSRSWFSRWSPLTLALCFHMFVIIGSLFVIACVFGGYAAAGGHLIALWQPFEVVIIVGAAIGAFIISNTMTVIKKACLLPVLLLKGSPYNKQSYIELLSLLFTVFKTAKTKGMLALESHVENPTESDIFAQFEGVRQDHHVLEFLCDYLRLFTLGTENPHELEDLIDKELEIHHEEDETVAASVQTMADGLPALGIVAAVLGVIHTMALIAEPPEILGKSIGAALAGTFLGVFLAYGFVGPTAGAVRSIQAKNHKYFECIKAGLIAYAQGYAPQVAIEFARKAAPSDVRPTFYEVEEAVANLGSG